MQERNRREDLLYLAQGGGEQSPGPPRQMSRHCRREWRLAGVKYRPCDGRRLCASSKKKKKTARGGGGSAGSVAAAMTGHGKPQWVSIIATVVMNGSKDGGEKVEGEELLNIC